MKTISCTEKAFSTCARLKTLVGEQCGIESLSIFCLTEGIKFRKNSVRFSKVRHQFLKLLLYHGIYCVCFNSKIFVTAFVVFFSIFSSRQFFRKEWQKFFAYISSFILPRTRDTRAVLLSLDPVVYLLQYYFYHKLLYVSTWHSVCFREHSNRTIKWGCGILIFNH